MVPENLPGSGVRIVSEMPVPRPGRVDLHPCIQSSGSDPISDHCLPDRRPADVAQADDGYPEGGGVGGTRCNGNRVSRTPVIGHRIDHVRSLGVGTFFPPQAVCANAVLAQAKPVSRSSASTLHPQDSGTGMCGCAHLVHMLVHRLRRQCQAPSLAFPYGSGTLSVARDRSEPGIRGARSAAPSGTGG